MDDSKLKDFPHHIQIWEKVELDMKKLPSYHEMQRSPEPFIPVPPDREELAALIEVFVNRIIHVYYTDPSTRRMLLASMGVPIHIEHMKIPRNSVKEAFRTALEQMAFETLIDIGVFKQRLDRKQAAKVRKCMEKSKFERLVVEN